MIIRRFIFLFVIICLIGTTSCGKVTQHKSYGNTPFLVVSNAEAFPGDTIDIKVSVFNNPGILAMTLSLVYDENALTLLSVENGKSLSSLEFTPPNEFKNGCIFLWDGVKIKKKDVHDGDILSLKFKVHDSISEGEYSIIINYDGDDIIDNDLNNIAFSIENGSVTVKK